MRMAAIPRRRWFRLLFSARLVAHCALMPPVAVAAIHGQQGLLWHRFGAAGCLPGVCPMYYRTVQ